MARDPIFAPPGHVNFNGEMLFKLYVENAGGTDTAPLDPLVAISQNKSYPGKSLIGDPTVETHDYLSTWGVSDVSGGHGIHNHRAGMTDNRYRESDMAVDRAGAWTTQLRAVGVSALGGGVCRPIGELFDGTSMVAYVCYGAQIWTFAGVTGDIDGGGVFFGATPVKEGTVFMDKLFVPLGSYGYGTWDGTTPVNTTASAGVRPAVVDFCLFGGTNLLALDTVGQLWSSVDGTAWDDIGVADGFPMKVQAGVRPRAIEEYRDGSGQPIGEVVTSGGVFNFDPAGPTLYPLGWRWPQHPRAGLASVVHQDTFFVSTGLGVRSLVNGSDSPVGLDRDDGLGRPMSTAYITSMATEYNAMWALVHSPHADGFNMLHRWDGMGWFEVWRKDSDGTIGTTSVIVTGANDLYFVLWGVGELLYYIRIPMGDTNPHTILYDEGGLWFNDDGFFRSGLTNFGMPGSEFTGVSFGVRCSFVAGDDSNGVPLVYTAPVLKYRTSIDQDWQVTYPQFDDLAVLPADGVGEKDQTLIFWLDEDFRGLVYQEIEFQLEITQGTVVKYVAHYFMKQMAGSRGIDLNLDLTGAVAGKAPHEQDAYLDEMILGGNIHRVTYGNKTIDIAFIQWTGNDKTGQHETRGVRKVSMFEVKDRP